MAMGRPPRPLSEHVAAVPGSDRAKHRAAVFFQTLGGEKTIKQAMEELGLSESQVHDLRRRFLEGAVGALEPRPTGRPRKQPAADSAAAEAAKEELELERTARIQAQLDADLLKAAPAPPDASKKRRS